MIDQDEKVSVAQAMIRYGGGFVKQLGVALMLADLVNQKKIKDTWPEYWETYKKKGE